MNRKQMVNIKYLLKNYVENKNEMAAVAWVAYI